jgi:hypothetical protein
MKRLLFLTLALAGMLAIPENIRSGAIGQGSQTCPASGNKALSTVATRAVWVNVQGPSANTGQIYTGGPGVTTSTADFFGAYGGFFFPPEGGAATYQLNQIYIACTNSADSVTYKYGQ